MIPNYATDADVTAARASVQTADGAVKAAAKSLDLAQAQKIASDAALLDANTDREADRAERARDAAVAAVATAFAAFERAQRSKARAEKFLATATIAAKKGVAADLAKAYLASLDATFQALDAVVANEIATTVALRGALIEQFGLPIGHGMVDASVGIRLEALAAGALIEKLLGKDGLKVSQIKNVVR